MNVEWPDREWFSSQIWDLPIDGSFWWIDERPTEDIIAALERVQAQVVSGFVGWANTLEYPADERAAPQRPGPADHAAG